MLRKIAWIALLLGFAAAIAWMLRQEHDPAPVGNAPGTTGESASTPADVTARELPPEAASPLRSTVDPQRGRLHVTVRRKHDDQILPDIPILVARGDGLNAEVWQHAGTTDSDGELQVSDLDPGWLAVRPGFVEQPQWREITAGSVEDLTFDLDGRTVVVGTVVDRDGNPVSGAEVWLSETARSTRGEVVTQTDAAGNFTTDFLGEGRFVAARAAGLGVSLPTAVMPDAEAPARVRLVLDGEAAHVTGEVVDQQGRPVVGATVVIGEFLELGRAALARARYGAPPLPQIIPPPVRVQTDRTGCFVATACATGKVPVMAWAAGFGLWQELTTISVDIENRVHVVLAAEALVSGQVRDAEGRGVAGAVVTANPRTGHPPTAAWQDWNVRCDEQGGYAFANLPPGEVRLEVKDHEHGTATFSVQLEAGQRFRWDPVLEAGLCLRIRVHDQTGVPMRGWRVSVSARAQDATRRMRLDSRHGMTDAAGRVVFAACLDAPYHVTASPAAGWLSWPGVYREEARPGDEIDMVVEPYQPPTAFVRGLVRDGSGHAVASVARMSYRRRAGDTGGSDRTFPLPPKAFGIGPLYDGIYQLGIKVENCAPITLPDFVIEGGVDLDLGTLLAEPSGTVSATVVDSDGNPCGVDRIWLVRDRQLLERLDVPAGKPVEFKDVASGTYELTAWSDTLGMCRQQLVVPAGGGCKLSLRLPGGVACEFELRRKSERFRVAELRWLDAQGNLLGEERVDEPAAGAPRVLRRVLPVGNYRIELRGLIAAVAAAADFQVVDPMPGPVLLDVRDVSRDEWRRWFR